MPIPVPVSIADTNPTAGEVTASEIVSTLYSKGGTAAEYLTQFSYGFDVHCVRVRLNVEVQGVKNVLLDDYINGYIDRCVDVICERHGIDKINILGICQGGVFRRADPLSCPKVAARFLNLAKT